MTSPLVFLSDFFAVSNPALSYAAELAGSLHTQLVLLHVRHDGLLAPYEYSNYYTPWGEGKAAEALHELAANQSVPTTVEISEAWLPDAVKEAVRLHQPLLLVLGPAGAANPPEGIVVQTAMNLLKNAPYPLLVVPAVKWDMYPPRRLLLTVDGEPFRLYPHPDVVRQLLRATQASFDVVHVIENDADEAPSADVLDTIRDNDLVDTLPEGNDHEVVQPTVVGGILHEIARRDAGMLVVIARRHSLLGSLFHESITAQLLRESPIPVLLLPAED